MIGIEEIRDRLQRFTEATPSFKKALEDNNMSMDFATECMHKVVNQEGLLSFTDSDVNSYAKDFYVVLCGTDKGKGSWSRGWKW